MQRVAQGWFRVAGRFHFSGRRITLGDLRGSESGGSAKFSRRWRAILRPRVSGFADGNAAASDGRGDIADTHNNFAAVGLPVVDLVNVDAQEAISIRGA